MIPAFGAGLSVVETKGGEVSYHNRTPLRRALGQYFRRQLWHRTTVIDTARRRARLFLPLLGLYGRNLLLRLPRLDLGSPLLFQTG